MKKSPFKFEPLTINQEHLAKLKAGGSKYTAFMYEHALKLLGGSLASEFMAGYAMAETHPKTALTLGAIALGSLSGGVYGMTERTSTALVASISKELKASNMTFLKDPADIQSRQQG